MVRIVRVVAPDMAHHITQRGNHGLETLFCDGDYEIYRKVMAKWCAGKRTSLNQPSLKATVRSSRMHLFTS